MDSSDDRTPEIGKELNRARGVKLGHKSILVRRSVSGVVVCLIGAAGCRLRGIIRGCSARNIDRARAVNRESVRELFARSADKGRVNKTVSVRRDSR